MDKVAWYSGLSLSQHHFQVQDNHYEQLSQRQTQSASEYFYGVRLLKLDQSQLEQSVITISQSEFILPDGSHLSLPNRNGEQVSLKLDEGFSGLIYLGLPMLSEQTKSVSEDRLNALAERYYMIDRTSYDAILGAESTEQVQVLMPNLRLFTDVSMHQSFTYIPLLKVKEVRSNGQVIIDDAYIPPLLSIHGNSILDGYLKEVLTLSQKRRKSLIQRLENVDDYGAVGLTELMLMQTLNRYEPLLNHLGSQRHPTPEKFFTLLIQLSSELRTYTNELRGYNDYPVYRHNDLSGTFSILMDDLRASFNYVFDEKAKRIGLEYFEKYGLYTANLNEIQLGGDYQKLILVCQAEIGKDQLALMLPKVVKIASREEIVNVVNKQLPGISIRVIPNPPRSLPVMKDHVYFELDPNSEYWKTIESTKELSLYLTKRFTQLNLQLWAVKG